MNQIEWQRKGKPLTEEELKQFQEHLDGKLPEDYTQFLTSINGGIPDRCIFEYAGSRSSEISELFSCGTHLMPIDRGQSYKAFDEIAKGYLRIGIDVGGNHLLLCVEPGAQNGRVSWKDHEVLDPRCRVFLVAQSFSGFLSMLKEEEKHQLDEVEALGMSGNASQAEAFLRRDGSVNARSMGDRTLAQEAARYGNMDVLSVCKEQGHSLSGAIHLAAMSGHENVLRYLIDNGLASVEDKNERGWTPLACAFIYPNAQVYLREKGAK